MEREAGNHYRTRSSARGNGDTAAERDLLLRWGNRKRLRCVKAHRRDVADAATATTEKAAARQRRAALQHHTLRNPEDTRAMRSSAQQQQQNNVIHMIASHDRERPVRGGNNSNNGDLPASPGNEKDSSSGSEGSVWPKFAVALTNKEKVDDFLVFKGSRPSHRP